MIELVEDKIPTGHMRGVKFERAKPSNILDVYALVKQAHKEDAFVHPKPTLEQVQAMYFDLLDALAGPTTAIFLARKGKSIVGMVQVTVSFRKVGPSPIGVIAFLYVIPKRRKLGIGRELMRHAIAELKKAGVPSFEFFCKDELVGYYNKVCQARKTLNMMVIE
jgi:GNAT superfamily N-acetyltransferase